MSEINKEILQKIFKPADLRQYITLRIMIQEGKILNTSQQKKFDTYEDRIENYVFMEQKKKDDVYIFPMNKICELFSISRQNFHKTWLPNPTFPKGAKIKDGWYNLKMVHDWWRAYFIGDIETATNMAIEKLKYQKQRSRREQLIVQELEGQLISREKVIEDINFINYGVKQKLLGWCRGLPAKLAHKDERKIMNLLQDEVHFILDELSQGVKRLFRKKKK